MKIMITKLKECAFTRDTRSSNEWPYFSH